MLYLRNEFAAVEVEVDETANGVRLRITDVETGASIWLDPFELSGLTHLSHEDFAAIVRPPA